MTLSPKKEVITSSLSFNSENPIALSLKGLSYLSD